MGKASKQKKKKAQTAQQDIQQPQAGLGSDNKALWWQALAVFLFAFALYANTLGHQYAVDDTIVILKNRLTQQGLAGIPELMTTDAFYGFFGENYKFVAGGRYRPLSIVTFAIEYEFFGETPWISHLINIILYGLTGVVILFMLQTMLRSKVPEKFALTVPFMAAVLYIAHPLHTEAVANIKGRDEIIGMLFALVTLWLCIKYVLSDKLWYLVVGLISFVLALLSKENPVTFLAVIPLAYFFFTDARLRHYAITMAPLLVIFGIYFYFRDMFTGVDLGAETQEVLNNPFVNPLTGEMVSASEKYATIIRIMGRYLWLQFVPHPLSHDYYYNEIPITGFNLWALLSLLVNGALVAYALKNFMKKDILSFSILYYFITLSVVTNIVIIVGTTMSERFLYMPSLGFCIAIPVLLVMLANKMNNLNLDYRSVVKSPLVAGVLIAVLALFSLKTILRNPAWENDFVLFGTDVENSPMSAKVRNAYGGELVTYADKAAQEGDEAQKQAYLQDAITHLNKAIEIYPTYLNAWLLLGNAYYKLTDDISKALPYYKRTIELKPSYFEGNYNLGSVYLQDEKPRQAIPYLERAVAAKPEKFEAHYNLAEAYYKAGLQLNGGPRNEMAQKAINKYQEVLQMRPDLASNIYYKIGVTYGRVANNLDRSIEYISKAIDLEPDNMAYYEDLGVAYGMKGELQNALRTFETALQHNPESAKIHMNIGITYQQLGQEDKAKAYFDKAAQLDPTLKR